MGIKETREFFFQGTHFLVGKGDGVRFWEDVLEGRAGEASIARFVRLYRAIVNKRVLAMLEKLYGLSLRGHLWVIHL